MVRYSAVYGAYAGSIPVRRATEFVVEHEWSSALPLKQVIAGSLPVHDAMGSNSTGGQRVVFQATIGRFDSGWPYQVLPPYHWWTWTCLLSRT